MQTDLQQNTPSEKLPFIGSVHLSNEQINYLLAQFGQFNRPSHILKDFTTTFKRDLSDKALQGFQKRYANDIKQVRDQWVNALADEAGSHKRVRVIKLYEMYCSLEDSYKALSADLSDDKLKVHKIGIVTYKQMESLLSSLRVEMEGNTLNINYRNLTTQADNDLIETARDVLNKVDPSLIEDANYKILADDDKDK